MIKWGCNSGWSGQIKKKGSTLGMGNYINIGNAGFAAVRKETYVDKSEMIVFINRTLGTKSKLTCVSRPRRFGKSYAAQMLCAYYDKSCDSSGLFADLAVAKDRSYQEHLNKHEVIYLDITWFIAITEDSRAVVSNMQEKVVEELRTVYPEVKQERTFPETLARINEVTGSRFIIIDEWDALFREAKDDHVLQEQYIQLLRGLFKSSGQTDKMIEAAYMTGILPIKKYGTHIYSPRSVIDALSRNRIGDYWTQSETYGSLKIYIDLDEDGLKEAIIQMLGGAKIKIDAGTFQNDMTTIQQKDDVLTLLVHLGYLAYDADARMVSIPNEEVRQEFVRAVSASRHKEVARLIRSSDRLLEQTLNMDEKAVAATIEEVHRMGTSPLFYNDEQALRSVIRSAHISCMDAFMKVEELASGRGYADIVYIPKRSSAMPILLIELKWDKTAGGAIGQIKKNDYPQVLKDHGGEILLVGISYDTKHQRHTCRIEKWDAVSDQ